MVLELGGNLKVSNVILGLNVTHTLLSFHLQSHDIINFLAPSNMELIQADRPDSLTKINDEISKHLFSKLDKAH